MVSDTRCPALFVGDCRWWVAGQRPQRGRCPVEHRGTFVCLSVCSFIHSPPPDQAFPASNIRPLRPPIRLLLLQMSFLRSQIRHPSLKSAFSGFKSVLSGLNSVLSGLNSAVSGLKSVLSDFKSALSSLKSALSSVELAFSGPISALLDL